MEMDKVLKNLAICEKPFSDLNLNTLIILKFIEDWATSNVSAASKCQGCGYYH